MLSQIAYFIWLLHSYPFAHTSFGNSYAQSHFTGIMGNLSPKEGYFHNLNHFVRTPAFQVYKPKMVSRRLAVLSAFFDHLAEEELLRVCSVIVQCCCFRWLLPLPRPMRVDVLIASFSMIKTVGSRSMFILIQQHELHTSEVTNQLVPYRSLDKSIPRLVVQGKHQHEYSVNLPTQAKLVVCIYLEILLQSTSDFVLFRYQSQDLSIGSMHTHPICYQRRSEECLTCHNLCHSFAHARFTVGTPVSTVQNIMNHRWQKITLTYINVNDQSIQANYYIACQKIED